jgi:hypothetical protein
MVFIFGFHEKRGENFLKAGRGKLLMEKGLGGIWWVGRVKVFMKTVWVKILLSLCDRRS